MSDTREPRARQAEDALSGLLNGLRGEVEDVAEVLAQERGATSADEGDISRAWEMVLSAIGSSSQGKLW